MKTFQNLLIVESPNDAAFIRLLLTDVDIGAETDTVVIEDLHKITDAKKGKEVRGKTAIGAKLRDINANLENYPNLKNLGIILDFDAPPNWDQAKNLQLVNDAIGNAFGMQPTISAENQFVAINTTPPGTDYDRQFQAACFFTKDSSGEGNLDTLLLEIRANPTAEVPYADCLALWRDCVNQSKSPLQVTPSVYGKIWLGNFLRAQAKGLGAAGKSVLGDFEDKQNEVLEQVGAAVFDLNHPSLSGMRAFLEMFR